MNIKNINDYFNSDGTPKTIPIKVNDKTSEIPLYTLINHQNLNISELEISFQTKLFGYRLNNISGSGVNDGGVYCDIHNHNKSTQDGGMATIKMVFKAGDKPESVSRINDMLIQKHNL
jgi:hypothetical protein